MSLDDFNDSLDSPLALRDTPDRRLAPDYRLCPRCWRTLAPVRRCRCAPPPESIEPPTPVIVTPALQRLADAVAAGRYADDRATREDRWLAWLAWLALLADRGQLDDWWHMSELDPEEDTR